MVAFVSASTRMKEKYSLSFSNIFIVMSLALTLAALCVPLFQDYVIKLRISATLASVEPLTECLQLSYSAGSQYAGYDCSHLVVRPGPFQEVVVTPSEPKIRFSGRISNTPVSVKYLPIYALAGEIAGWHCVGTPSKFFPPQCQQVE